MDTKYTSGTNKYEFTVLIQTQLNWLLPQTPKLTMWRSQNQKGGGQVQGQSAVQTQIQQPSSRPTSPINVHRTPSVLDELWLSPPPPDDFNRGLTPSEPSQFHGHSLPWYPASLHWRTSHVERCYKLQPSLTPMQLTWLWPHTSQTGDFILHNDLTHHHRSLAHPPTMWIYNAHRLAKIAQTAKKSAQQATTLSSP